MAKYSKYNPRDRMAEPRWKIHPIWRGIGCLLIIMIPIMAYAGAVLLVDANNQQGWLPVPMILRQVVSLPFIGSVPYLGARLLTSGVLMIIGFAVLMILYSMLYKIIGPPQYGPLDAPPQGRPPGRRR